MREIYLIRFLACIRTRTKLRRAVHIQDALISSSYIFFSDAWCDFIYLYLCIKLRKKFDENNDTISRKILLE